MTLLDSIDSILMLYSYTGFTEHRFRIFEPARENDGPDHMTSAYREAAATSVSAAQLPRPRGIHDDETERCPLSGCPPAPGEQSEQNGVSQEDKKQPVEVQVEEMDARITDIRREAQRELMVKRNMMSGLSILLTLMSIVVAFRCEIRRGWLLCDSLDGQFGFSISLITIMGLIGEKCGTCIAAAENDKGLAGGWWRLWAEVFRVALSCLLNTC